MNGVAAEAGEASAAGDGARIAEAPLAALPRALPVGWALGALLVLALVAALYLARGFCIPLLIGILASYALHPLVDLLERSRVPRAIGAALVLALVVGGIAWIGVAVRADAESMIEKLPQAARGLRNDLSEARSGAPTALQHIQAAAQELEGAATDAGTRSTAKARARPVAPPSAAAPTWLRDYALAQSALLVSVAAQAPIVLLLIYFLLASGDHFRRKLLQLVGPSLSQKKDAVRILDEIDVQVQRYLLAMLLSNILLGLATWLAFLALGLEHAGVWGLAAGIFHFVPYLGPALVALASGVAGYLQFGTVAGGLLAGGASLLVAGAIGFAFMTWLQSRFARVNAAVLFIALLFFGWLWGVWGVLLGSPLVAIAKVVFDRIDGLKPAGELLGR